MNTAEKLAREIRRVTELRCNYGEMSSITLTVPMTGVADPWPTVAMNQTLDRACVAAGSNDKVAVLTALRDLGRFTAMTTRTGTPLQAIKFALEIEGEYPVSTQGFLQSWWDGELDAVNLTEEFTAFCVANPDEDVTAKETSPGFYWVVFEGESDWEPARIDWVGEPLEAYAIHEGGGPYPIERLGPRIEPPKEAT